MSPLPLEPRSTSEELTSLKKIKMLTFTSQILRNVSFLVEGISMRVFSDLMLLKKAIISLFSLQEIRMKPLILLSLFIQK